MVPLPENGPVAGVDGCPDGWLYVLEAGPGRLDTGVAPDLSTLLDVLAPPTVVAVDVPIGLPEKGPRACDGAARDLLTWPRTSSVFPAPIRPVLTCDDHREASDAHRAIDGRGMSAQAFGILPKIREVDAFLRSLAASERARIHEVHPEVSFHLWNGGRSMQESKKTLEGRAERLALIDAVWPGAVGRLELALKATRARCAPDDLLDALAALWSARRIREGTAMRLPPEPVFDDEGLPMVITG